LIFFYECREWPKNHCQKAATSNNLREGTLAIDCCQWIETEGPHPQASSGPQSNLHPRLLTLSSLNP